MIGEFSRYSFVAESVYSVFNAISNLADGHQIERVNVRSVRNFQMVWLTTNACRQCVVEAMSGEDDELMLPTLRQLQPKHGSLN
jgi:hypothetical protein